tara:strand:- start:217 stop:789 length:573 start_codon:yes stop_codon:yes gene_type:complete
MSNLDSMVFFPEINLVKQKWDIHAVYIPEREFDLSAESDRLLEIMDKYDCVNIFLSEGAGLDNIIKEMKSNNQDIPTDAFGHIRLDEINPGRWYADFFKNKLNCDKVLVQKSGYFSRSSAPNRDDLDLINNHASLAVKSAISNISGVIGIDDNTNTLSCIAFDRIKGGKPFNINLDWFNELMQKIENVNY